MTVFEGNRNLLEGFRRGDREALTTVYLHYFNTVENWVRCELYSRTERSRNKRNRSYDVQLEIVQDIFIRAFSEQARDAYDGLRSYKNFLFTIARNIVIDFLRKNQSDALAHLWDDGEWNILYERIDISIPEFASDPEGEEEKIYWQRCIAASEEYVAGLTQKEQALILLRFRDELPQRTVADRLNMTHWKVRSIEKKVQKGLRRHLRISRLIK